MKADLEELRKMAILWNEERQASKSLHNLFIAGIMLVFIGSYFIISMKVIEDPNIFGVLLGLIPLVGIVLLVSAFKQKNRTYELKKRLNGLDPGRLTRFRNEIDETASLMIPEDPEAFSFHYDEGFGQNRHRVIWKVNVKEDYIVIVKASKDEVHFLKFDELKILKGNKAFLSGDFAAKTQIGGEKYDVEISPQDYEKYVKSLQKVFLREEADDES